MPIYAGLEAGGTKFVCAIARGPDEILLREQFPTTTPNETIQRTVDFFRNQPHPLDALGIGSFGPLDPHPASPTYGYITKTPKPGWSNTDLAGPLRQALNIPVAFDTDVNAAALGEYRWGAAQGLETFVYMTVGTGIGGGAFANRRLLHGLMHPEMGHILIPHDRQRDPYPGFCPFHGDCLEGLAAGPALEGRWGRKGQELPPEHPAWALEAHYLALGLEALFTILSPQRVILGGGVMQQPHLLPMVRDELLRLLNGYLQIPVLLHEINRLIVPPALGSNTGVLGAIALAETALQPAG
jgi:fructokinase